MLVVAAHQDLAVLVQSHLELSIHHQAGQVSEVMVAVRLELVVTELLIEEAAVAVALEFLATHQEQAATAAQASSSLRCPTTSLQPSQLA